MEATFFKNVGPGCLHNLQVRYRNFLGPELITAIDNQKIIFVNNLDFFVFICLRSFDFVFQFIDFFKNNMQSVRGLVKAL